VSLLCTGAECVVIRVWRYVAFGANVYELRLLPQQIDNLAHEVPSDAEPREDPFVFRNDSFRNQPGEGLVV
jgi:hypothetical protein